MGKGRAFGKTILIGDQFVNNEVPAIGAGSWRTIAMRFRVIKKRKGKTSSNPSIISWK
jgi:hypothetical protein